MGSEKLEEWEGSLGAAKYPQSQPFYDAKFPPKAQLSKIPARKGREGTLQEDQRQWWERCIYKFLCLLAPHSHPAF